MKKITVERCFIFINTVVLLLIVCLGWTYTYDTDTPLGTDAPSTLDDHDRLTKDALQERLNIEHIFDKTGSEVSHADTGKHTDITCYSVTSTGALSGTTISGSGNLAINTDKFTVTAATGNTLVVGTLDVSGNMDPTTYETTNGGFLDEDDMASDAADKVASQQSIAAYVANIVGTQTTLDSTSGTLVDGETYKVGSAGMVKAAIGGAAEGSQTLSLYTDGSNPPTTLVDEALGNAGGEKISVGFLIKKDNYFRITTSGAAVPTVYWCPLGAGTAVKQ